MSREEIFNLIKEAIVEQLGVDEEKITEDATFSEDLSADSLDLVELIMNLEVKLEIEIPDNEAEKITFLIMRGRLLSIQIHILCL